MGRELPARCRFLTDYSGVSPLSSTGKSELAIAEADKAIALDPDTGTCVFQQGIQSALAESP